MKEFIQSTPHVPGTSARAVFKSEFSRRPKDFCNFLQPKLELCKRSRTHTVPLEPCCLKDSVSEGKEVEHTYTGNVRYLRSDQVVHCPFLSRVFRHFPVCVCHCWPRATKMPVTSETASHHIEKTPAHQHSPAL